MKERGGGSVGDWLVVGEGEKVDSGFGGRKRGVREREEEWVSLC